MIQETNTKKLNACKRNATDQEQHLIVNANSTDELKKPIHIYLPTTEKDNHQRNHLKHIDATEKQTHTASQAIQIIQFKKVQASKSYQKMYIWKSAY